MGNLPDSLITLSSSIASSRVLKSPTRHIQWGDTKWVYTGCSSNHIFTLSAIRCA